MQMNETKKKQIMYFFRLDFLEAMEKCIFLLLEPKHNRNDERDCGEVAMRRDVQCDLDLNRAISSPNWLVSESYGSGVAARRKDFN